MSAPLAQTTGNERNILLVSPPYLPYMPAWENLDIDSRRVVMVRVHKPAERLWALEQGIRSGAFGAVIGWLPEASQQTTRKLQILARSAAMVVFLLQAGQCAIGTLGSAAKIIARPSTLPYSGLVSAQAPRPPRCLTHSYCTGLAQVLFKLRCGLSPLQTNTMLWIALHCPALSLDCIERRFPAALIPPMAVTVRKGNRVYVQQANQLAQEQGIMAHQSLASALALFSDLVVMEQDLAEEMKALQEAAYAALRFTPNIVLQHSWPCC